MNEFEERLTCPSEDNPFYNEEKNIFAQCGYGMFENGGNCTAYAWGRALELGADPERLKDLHGNAEKWFSAAIDAGFPTGRTPKLGAIACWKDGDEEEKSDGAGHVMVVEEIYNDGSFLCSSSGYHSYLFNMRSVGPDCYYNGHEFQGFIYPVDFGGEEMTRPEYVVLAKCLILEHTNLNPDDSEVVNNLVNHFVENNMTVDECDLYMIAGRAHRERTIATYYVKLLGREGSEDEIRWWADTDYTLREIMLAFYDSDEYHNK